MNSTTIRTWKPGDSVICNGNKEASVTRIYSAPCADFPSGAYVVRLWSGDRHIGDVCISGRDLSREN